ncbi:hypothetical protein [Pelagibacterium sediminicola]|uniref:hypothetical protein n=1 Tax=Pelagibacterium sediminicola TaxID=2248761 RepID=UPI000E30E7A9|nr:hypothetical protein [Pelagibacterium sediminicola]
MFKKTLVAPIALAFGLTLTGAAAAQVMVGDQEVSDADLAAVQEHCDALELAASTAPTGEAPTVDINSDPTLGVELASITLQQCVDAGLIEGPVPGLTPNASDGDSSDDMSADDGTGDPNEDTE